MQLANVLICGGLTGLVAMSIGFAGNERAGWLAVAVGAILTGVVLALRGQDK